MGRSGGRGTAPRRQATAGVDRVGHGDLLEPGGQVGARGILPATVAQPGAAVELEATVVAVAGVDRPVAAGLTLGDPVPHRRVGRGTGCNGTGLGADGE